MENKKPLASLSLDLDNQWSYMKTHGDPGWETFPSYLDLVVPRILKLLKEMDLTITFFIVGQDAALEKNQRAIRMIAEAGHEIGNHSYNHEPWLQFYTEQQVEDEIVKAEECIERVTGVRPVGFRGPGYSISAALLTVLRCRGYLYDASILSTFLGPAARLYYFMTSKLSKEEKRQRSLLFGNFRDGLRANRPHLWHHNGHNVGTGLIEIPVTTMPFFRLPFHVSYILYISSFFPHLAFIYFKFALSLCLITKTNPSLLLHPLDFLSDEDIHELSFFPAMNMPLKKKMYVVGKVLRMYDQAFNLITMRQHAGATNVDICSLEIEKHFKMASNY
jgi:peptidoglycan-N-acetylglucosamine deacetylase